MDKREVLKMDEIPDELRDLCVLWVKPGVFIKDTVKLASDVEHYVRQREDAIRKQAANRILRLLPDDYWDTITKHLPKYHHRDDVLHSDMMTRIVEGEEIEDEDRDRFLAELGRMSGVELESRIHDLELFLEAKEAMDEDQIQKDTFFLQEIVNDLISRNGPGMKGMDLAFDWLTELKEKSKMVDGDRFIEQFKEYVGASNWDQNGYDLYLEAKRD